jgi:phosphoglycerol transferase
VLSFIDIKIDLGLGRDLRDSDSIYKHFNDFDKKLNQWRDYILDFWQFSKISDNLKIDLKKMSVDLESSSYKLPVLLKVLNDRVEPYFEFNNSWRLYLQLENFKEGNKFLWVDKCDLMNYIFDTNASGKHCVAEGILGFEYKVAGVDRIKNYKIANFSNTQNDKNGTLEKILSHIDMLKRNGLEYKSTLKDPIIFKKEGYPSFLKDMQGVSYSEKNGRWTDADISPNAVFTFKEPLPAKFKLEIVCKTYNKNKNENIVKVKVGNSIREFAADYENSNKYTIEFDNSQNSNIIEIVPPKPFEPKEKLEGSDTRRLGIFLVSLKIIDTKN